MNPKTVCGQQVGYIRDTQRLAGAIYFDFYLWPGQIEGIIRPRQSRPYNSQHGNRQGQTVSHQPGINSMKHLSDRHIDSFPIRIGTGAKSSGSMIRREYESAFV
jgi:hypothetical protein